VGTFLRHSVVIGGLVFYHGFFLLFRRLIFEFAERNPTKIGHMLGSNCNLKTHVQNLGYPLPYKSGAQNHLFGRLRNLTATLTAYIFGMKHEIHKQASALQTIRGLLYCLKTTWTLVHKRLQIEGEFSPTLRKFCIPLYCQALQTEINRRNSIKLCQTVAINRGNNLPLNSWAPQKKLKAKKLLNLFSSMTTSRLNGECLLKETW